MKQLLREYFQLANTPILKTKNAKEFQVIYIDPKLSTDPTFGSPQNQEIVKKYGAEWLPYNRFIKYAKGVPHAWGWVVWKGQESDKYPYINKFAEEIGALETPKNEGENRTAEEVLGDIDEELRSAIANSNFSAADKILREAEKYKEMLAKGIGSKETMDALARLVQYRRELEKTGGYSNYSWLNTLLIMWQKPNATDIRSKGEWLDGGYNIKQGAVPIILSMPKKFGKLRGKLADEITKKYLTACGVTSVDELNKFQQRSLNRKLSYPIPGAGFKPYETYDISDVEPGPNAIPIEKVKEKLSDVFQWFVKLPPTQKELALINACIAWGKSIGIRKYIYVGKEELGTSRGSASSNGIVRVIDEDKDLGILSTTIHETAHQIMHWTVVRDNSEMMKKYYRGGSMERGTKIIEQEAELTAWVVLTGFGYRNLQPHFNYLANWGMDVTNCSSVFDAIMRVANEIHKGMIKNLSMENITEYNFDKEDNYAGEPNNNGNTI